MRASFTSTIPSHRSFDRFFLSSKVPQAVEAWRSGLTSKSRKKLASSIASPTENVELFPEGWDSVLERESDLKSQARSLVNGHAGECCKCVLNEEQVLTFSLRLPSEPPIAPVAS